jgi:hypothetical protein
VIDRARDAVIEGARQVGRNGWQWVVDQARARWKGGQPEGAKTDPGKPALQKPAEAGKAKT